MDPRVKPQDDEAGGSVLELLIILGLPIGFVPSVVILGPPTEDPFRDVPDAQAVNWNR